METVYPPHIIGKADTDIISPLSRFVLSKSLPTFNGLFFILYTLKYIFKQRWLLVLINNEETAILNMQPETTGDYHVTFLVRHLADID